MAEENGNYQDFLKDMRATMGSVNIGAPSLIKLTKDNSFVDFCNEFCNHLFQNVDEAILEKEVTHFEQMKQDQHRYLSTLFKALDIRVPEDSAITAIKKVNFVFKQWLRMINESKIDKDFSENVINELLVDINELEDILDMSSTVARQMEMADNLIKKAYSVLAATPKAFNMSKSFADAVMESMEE